MIARRAITTALSTFLFAGQLLAQTVAEPDDFRDDEYRSPVPETLTGAIVVSTDTAFALWKTDRVAFVDVFPQPPKPANLPKGTLFREKPRHSIPGAIWLPNVGYGKIADVTADYFRAGLSKITNGDTTMPVVFFCLEDCWMSWNAAKRALEYGYSHVYWFPDGTDGWEFYDHPIIEIERYELVE